MMHDSLKMAIERQAGGHMRRNDTLGGTMMGVRARGTGVAFNVGM